MNIEDFILPLLGKIIIVLIIVQLILGYTKRLFVKERVSTPLEWITEPVKVYKIIRRDSTRVSGLLFAVIEYKCVEDVRTYGATLVRLAGLSIQTNGTETAIDAWFNTKVNLEEEKVRTFCLEFFRDYYSEFFSQDENKDSACSVAISDKLKAALQPRWLTICDAPVLADAEDFDCVSEPGVAVVTTAAATTTVSTTFVDFVASESVLSVSVASPAAALVGNAVDATASGIDDVMASASISSASSSSTTVVDFVASESVLSDASPAAALGNAVDATASGIDDIMASASIFSPSSSSAAANATTAATSITETTATSISETTATSITKTTATSSAAAATSTTETSAIDDVVASAFSCASVTPCNADDDFAPSITTTDTSDFGSKSDKSNASTDAANTTSNATPKVPLHILLGCNKCPYVPYLWAVTLAVCLTARFLRH